MVVTDGQGNTQEEENRSPQMFPFEEKRHTRQRNRHVGNHITLYDMSGFDDNQIIGSQSKGKRACQSQPPAGAHHTHQQIETNQSGKDHGSITIT